MPNLELTPKTHVSSFRKIAIGTWATAYDPSVYGSLEVRMDEAMRYLADFRARTGRRLTISHMMAKVAAMALKEVPDANAVLRWNRIYLRKRSGSPTSGRWAWIPLTCRWCPIRGCRSSSRSAPSATRRWCKAAPSRWQRRCG
jgi:hypothetical protein